MTITHEKLIQWNKQGLIPGPYESDSDFLERVDYCLNLETAIQGDKVMQGFKSESFVMVGDHSQMVKAPTITSDYGLKDCVNLSPSTAVSRLNLKDQFSSELGQQLPMEVATMPQKLRDEVNKSAFDLYGIMPDWIPIVFSNYKMAPWHGGCAWIYQLTENGPTGAFFQLRKQLATSQYYLGMYDGKELIVHETAHVGRMLFHEPKFEETLAYRSSKSRFRQFLGSAIQSAWESLLFVFILFSCIAAQLYFVISGVDDQLHLVTYLQELIVVMIAFGLFRAWLRQRQIKRCLKVLREIFNDESKANAVLYRLQDAEIIAFGKMCADKVVKYAENNREGSLRWKMIYEAYFLQV